MSAWDERTPGKTSLQEERCGPMKRLRIIGLSLVAAVALSAIAAGSAAAEAPEYGTCVAKAGGKFADRGCTKEIAGKTKFEWVPGVGAKTKFTSKSKEASVVTLETVTKKAVICKGQTGTGEYTGPKTVGGVVETLTGCELAAAKCTTAGQAEGTVKTVPLSGVLGITKKGLSPNRNDVGNALSPTTGETVAEFSCATTPVVVKGKVIGQISGKNKSLPTLGIKFVQAKGKQKPERFEGGEKLTLTASLEAGPFVQSGLHLETLQTSEEPIEANTVV
jgi:hypothetical protein